MRSTRSTSGAAARRQVFEQLGGGLGELGAGLDEVIAGLGVFDERGRGADLAGEESGGLGGEIGRSFIVEGGADPFARRAAEEECRVVEVRVRALRDIDHRMRTADAPQLRVTPHRPLCSLVLGVADLCRILRERLLGSGRIEVELDHLPVAFVRVVEVVEDVEEPVLQRELVRKGALFRDVGIDRRRGAPRDPPLPELVAAAGVEGIAGKVEVVPGEAGAEVGAGRPDLHEIVRRPRTAKRDGVLSEERAHVDRAVGLAGPADVLLLDELDDRGVFRDEPLLGAGGGRAGRGEESHGTAERGGEAKDSTEAQHPLRLDVQPANARLRSARTRTARSRTSTRPSSGSIRVCSGSAWPASTDPSRRRGTPSTGSRS